MRDRHLPPDRSHWPAQESHRSRSSQWSFNLHAAKNQHDMPVRECNLNNVGIDQVVIPLHIYRAIRSLLPASLLLPAPQLLKLNFLSGSSFVSSSVFTMISSTLLFAIPLALQANAASIPASAKAIGLDISTTLQNILANTQNSDGYTYPTDLTRGIVPVSSYYRARFGLLN